MRTAMIGILLAVAVFPLAGCTKNTLDLILGGPFVFFRQTNCLNHTEDCIAVWIPDVPSHSKPVLFGVEGQFYELEKMPADYTLTGMTPSINYSFLAPVSDSSSWVIPGKTLQISPVPKKKPYLVLKLPIPKEIVPWNADPLDPKITSPAPHVPGAHSFATMIILRYEYEDSKTLMLQSPAVEDSKGIELNLETPRVGKERVLMIQVIPQKPDRGDEHQHSREAYQEVMAMLGLQGDITFPPLPGGYKRNTPLKSGVLPDDLLDFITSGVVVGRGRINDCKAMAVFVDATK